MPAVWRRSVSECLAVIDFLDARIEPLDRELRPFAHADPRAVLLDTIPGVADLLALTIAVEIGEISRFARPESSCPTVDSRHASTSRVKLGPAAARSASRATAARLAAVEAAQQAWRESNTPGTASTSTSVVGPVTATPPKQPSPTRS
jgi:transposase